MKKPTYENIRHLTVGELKTYPSFILKCVENQIKKENERAELALKWVQGIQRMQKSQGEQNGN